MKYITTLNKTCATDIIRVYYNPKSNIFILKERGSEEKITYNFKEKSFININDICNLYKQMIIHIFFIYNNDLLIEFLSDINSISNDLVPRKFSMPNINYNNPNFIYGLNDILSEFYSRG